MVARLMSPHVAPVPPLRLPLSLSPPGPSSSRSPRSHRTCASSRTASRPGSAQSSPCGDTVGTSSALAHESRAGTQEGLALGEWWPQHPAVPLRSPRGSGLTAWPCRRRPGTPRASLPAERGGQKWGQPAALGSPRAVLGTPEQHWGHLSGTGDPWIALGTPERHLVPLESTGDP